MELRCCINITCRKLFQCWIHWFEKLGSSVTFRNLRKSRLTTLPCCIHNLQPPNMEYDRNSLSKYLTKILIQSNVTGSLKKVGTWGHCRRWVSCWRFVFSSGFWCKMCEWYRGLQLNVLHWLYWGFRSLMASWEFFCCGQLPALPFVLALWFDTNFTCSVQSFSWKCQRVLCAELCLSCYNCEAHPWGKKI